ncbi:MAG: hypothetical protein GYB66_06805, partial [Chloroflexi bacterium]|nr:hypothetical protein [Chloroflexota bacterium]
PQPIIDYARGLVGPEELAVDKVLDEIQRSRDEIRATLERLQRAEADSRAVRNSLDDRLEAIEEERRQVVAETQRQGETELEELRREMRRLKRQMEAAGQPLDAIREMQKAAAELQAEEYIHLPEREADEQDDDSNGYQFRLGDTVWVTSLKSEGQIVEVTENEVEVLVGRLRIRAKPNEVEYMSRKERKRPRREREYAPETTVPERGPSPGLELDLRGSRIEDAIPQVEEYLDAAYMAALPFVRIIHGKGTGALRKAVREALSHHPLVSKQASGSEKEGGNGVTIVHLVTQQ